jgi:hypothetical protein
VTEGMHDRRIAANCRELPQLLPSEPALSKRPRAARARLSGCEFLKIPGIPAFL